jgi:hypothetical protein
MGLKMLKEVEREATVAINARDVVILAGSLAAFEDDSSLSREEFVAGIGCVRRQIARNAQEIVDATEARA